MPIIITLAPSGAYLPPGVQAATIMDIDACFAYLEARTTANNTESGGDLTGSANRIAAGPDGLTVAGQRPGYLAGRQNGNHGWVFGTGTDHIKLAPSAPQDQFDVNGGYVAIAFKSGGLGDSAFPRLWAQSDAFYVHLQAGASPDAHKLGFYRRFSGSDAWYVSANDVVSDGQAHIVELVFDAASPGVPPVLRVDGVAIQLVQNGVGSGTAENTAGKAIHLGNRQEDESGTFFLNRGFAGDIYAFVAVQEVPAIADQKTVLDELAAEWGIAVADPFLPSVEAQSFSVNEAAQAGTLVGTVQAQNAPSLFVLSGDAASYFTMEGDAIKVSAALPAAGTLISGTITVSNASGSDNAALSVTTVATGADALKYPAPNLSVFNQAINLGATNSVQQSFLSSDKVAVYGADTVRTATRTWIEGAGSVAFIGGHYRPSSKTNDRAIYAKDIHDEIYVEGLVVEPRYAQDAFQFSGASGKKPLVTFQLVWCEGLDALQSTKHSDWAQPLGPVGAIRLYECFGECGYQGLYFDDDNASGAKVDRVELEEVSMVHLNSDPNVGHAHSYLIWLDTTYANGASIGPGVYVTEKTGQSAEASSVWPKAPAAQRSGDLIAWPGTNISGSVIVGNRPGGPKLDKSSIGIVAGQAYLNVRGYAA